MLGVMALIRGLVHEAGAATGPVLAMATLPKLRGQDRRELRLPRPYRLVAEDEPGFGKHLAEVAQSEAVAQAQAPQHPERDHVAWILRPVQRHGAALVRLRTAVTAAKATTAPRRAVRPFGDRRRAPAHALHVDVAMPSR
jgi:hypothetical protein